MSITNIVITTVDTAAMVLDQLDPQPNSDTNASLQRLARYIDGLGDGAFYFNSVVEDVGAVQSVGTLTISSTGPTAGEVGTVVNQNLTAETSGANPTLGQFNINASPTLVAASIALAINSTPAMNSIVTATSSLGVVTITAKHAGNTGNGLELSAGNLANTVASGFAGGTNGTKVTLS
jgi:phage tail sheath gpL-like